MTNKFFSEFDKHPEGTAPTEKGRGKPASSFDLPQKNISWPGLPGKDGTQKWPIGSGTKGGFNHLVKKGVR